MLLTTNLYTLTNLTSDTEVDGKAICLTVDTNRYSDGTKMIEALHRYAKDISESETNHMPVLMGHKDSQVFMGEDGSVRTDRQCGFVTSIDYLHSLDGEVHLLKFYITTSNTLGKALEFINNIEEQTVIIQTLRFSETRFEVHSLSINHSLRPDDVRCKQVVDRVNESNALDDKISKTVIHKYRELKKYFDNNPPSTFIESISPDYRLFQSLDYWIVDTIPHAQHRISDEISRKTAVVRDLPPTPEQGSTRLMIVSDGNTMYESEKAKKRGFLKDCLRLNSSLNVPYETAIDIVNVIRVSEAMAKRSLDNLGLIMRATGITGGSITKGCFPLLACKSIFCKNLDLGEDMCENPPINATYSTSGEVYIGKIDNICYDFAVTDSLDLFFEVEVVKNLALEIAMAHGVDNLRIVPQGVCVQVGDKKKLVGVTHFKLSTKEHAELEMAMYVSKEGVSDCVKE